ncbi:AFR717Wp [Eremothecium gossypii ATCC 10895]|uniref:AFR717Wp n=1 Tax=Eremothecium gossypii (strain ATCC 10895 / CBS 109.51 / FGSC 9923 / NRRL Y-1056) TaxID=284811 RepID=Q751V8_EREGS|nr:AFR717Wp [Eremothecium gossypii ATCC 10895]AAS54089.1 AFR717Wp [Eremothecium gossypii ATCC 10895]AEY98404.1 FAFR717Wp [Eremothecium gossypii FDAG1]
MLRIAKNLVKTFEQSVQDMGLDRSLDVYFQSIPPQLLEPGRDTTATVHGLRVLRVAESQLQLCSFFDYIVGIDGEPLPTAANQHGFLHPDYQRIFAQLNARSGGSVQLNVWSAKGGMYRDEYLQLQPKSAVEDVPLEPEASQPAHCVFEPLGFSVQWTPLLSATYTYHVLNINMPGGPAAASGIVPQDDYIVGCQEGLLATGGETILPDIVRARAGRDLELYVYNSPTDTLRPVTVHIGPDGRLGCGVGYGFLHRVPAPALRASTDAFVPAAALAHPAEPAHSEPAHVPPADMPLPLPAPRKKRHPAHSGAAAAMQDYFQEGKDASPRITPAATPVPPPQSSR